MCVVEWPANLQAHGRQPGRASTAAARPQSCTAVADVETVLHSGKDTYIRCNKKRRRREKKEGREHKLTLSRCKCTAVDPTLRSRTKPTRSYGPSCTRPGHSVCTGSIWVWSEDSPRANASTTAPLLALPLALGNIFSSLLYCTLSTPPPLCRAHCRECKPCIPQRCCCEKCLVLICNFFK